MCINVAFGWSDHKQVFCSGHCNVSEPTIFCVIFRGDILHDAIKKPLRANHKDAVNTFSFHFVNCLDPDCGEQSLF